VQGVNGEFVNLTFPSDLDASQFPRVDTREPVITGISTTSQAGVYGAGRVIRIAVTFSVPISIDLNGGSLPTLDLNSKGTAVFAGIDTKVLGLSRIFLLEGRADHFPPVGPSCDEFQV